ncbi:uncharacterized protein LOC125950909 [Anopheles darlingi]|uniref:uncharacterized protein LOC125950909 n=1 Tax=Anopheles darlingi TaxID=43151 RepID=UPI0021000A96|nr:uncharacterized protein LOC125950909 [Anopheles darlingi]
MDESVTQQSCPKQQDGSVGLPTPGDEQKTLKLSNPTSTPDVLADDALSTKHTKQEIAIKQEIKQELQDDTLQDVPIQDDGLPSIPPYNVMAEASQQGHDRLTDNRDHPFDVFGRYVAFLLHKMPHEKAVRAQQEMLNCVLRAKQGTGMENGSASEDTSDTASSEVIDDAMDIKSESSLSLYGD